MAKTALVTGGAKRLGRSIALALADLSYDIALHYNSSAGEAEATAAAVRERGVRCELFKCDLAVEKELIGLIGRVSGVFPELAVLVNNASVFLKGRVTETEPEIYERLLAVNFKAPFFLSRDFARLRGQGQIINLLDTRIAGNDFGYAVYTITRKALAELTKACAREFAPGIRVNAIAPGIILPPPGESADYLDKMASRIPLRRKGEPTNVVEALKFCLGSDFLTGQIIFIDGGESLG